METSELSYASIDTSDAVMAVKVAMLMLEAKTVLKPPRTLKAKEWPPKYEEVLVWRRSYLARYETDPKFLASAKKYYAKNCVAFINHWCDTYDPRNVGTDKPVWMPFVLFDKQEDLVKFVLACLKEDAPGLIEKCRTMGATWICVAISVWLWLFHPGVVVGWGSQDAVTVDRIGDSKSIFWKIRELIARIPAVFKPAHIPPEHLKQYVCYNAEAGSSIVGEVGDKIGRGGRTRIYFKDESAHYEHPELIEASLSENTRVPIDISSVNGLGNLFHRKREAGIDWYPGAEIEKGYTRVFVMDWSDHPEYNQEWYDDKRKHHERQGTLHVFAQEIERNYSAAVEGVIIPAIWVDAAVDAHKVLGLDNGGLWGAALDVADEGGDRNALVKRQGIVLRSAKEWGERDTGVTARRALAECEGLGPLELQYDCLGVGSGVKAESNRLKDDNLMPRGLVLVAWPASGKVLRPADRVIPGDKESPRNKDFYYNLKAQAWWELRLRFYRTYQAVVGIADEEGKLVRVQHDPDDLISLDSTMPLLHKVKKELSQATASKGTKMKLVVDKAPEGTRSPNLADAVVMAYTPLPQNVGDFTMIGTTIPRIYIGGEQVN